MGGLDEASFMYGEEMDWSWRARALGFSTVFSTRVRVRHHGGASGAGARGELFVHVLRARLTFLDRYRGRWRAMLSREVLVGGAALRLVVWSAIALLQRIIGRRSAHAADQIERFHAVVRWRLGGGAW
jgi:GT2 family glycosyltransferase